MLAAMANARVGDDVYQSDPTTNEFEDRVARLAGKEAAIFMPTGTMSNQIAIRTHLQQPPYSVLCDERAHIHIYEAGGIAFHTGASTLAVRPAEGTYHLTADVVGRSLILDDDVHHAPTRLVCLENTMNGEVFPLAEQQKISALVHTAAVKLHLDGARIWNALTSTNLSLLTLLAPYETASLCFSKGLGAPMGSVLVGPGPFIRKARHFRKLFGGGMRQTGLLTAACAYGLDNHLPLMKGDHTRTGRMAAELVRMGYGLSKRTDSNMVWVDTSPFGLDAEDLSVALGKRGILSFGGTEKEVRLVFHHQIEDHHVDVALQVFREAAVRSGGRK